jgi:LacI family transcriptional regulator
VPEQVAVIGADNTALVCDYAPVPLSSVDSDTFGLGMKAAQVLQASMEGAEPIAGQIIRVPPRAVVMRASTDFPAVSNPLVVEMLKRIRAQCCIPVTVEELMSAMPASRATLYRAFVEEVGHSPIHELSRLRIEHAKRLLTDQRLSIAEVARASGYRQTVVFSRMFARLTGQQPSVWRMGLGGRDTGVGPSRVS